MRPWIALLAVSLITTNALNGCIHKNSATHLETHQAPELTGRVVTGYQGWFNAHGDGIGRGFSHWAHEGLLKPGNVTFDMWPDMTDYPQNLRYDTVFRHADGSVGQVFSSADSGTVRLHFGWMRDYGIGGAMCQRFATATRSNHPNPRVRRGIDQVFQNIRLASRDTGTPWALMYDLSGLQPGEVVRTLRSDLERLIEEFGDFRHDPHYLHHKGKPLIAVWGVGFNDDRKYSLDECIALAALLQDQGVDGFAHGGNALMLGVPTWWRTLEGDSVSDPRLLQLIQQADVVSPWTVGRMHDLPSVDEHAQTALAPDVAWISNHASETAYLPVIFPGFSWANLKSRRGETSEFNSIPRLRGEFLWRQAFRAINEGQAEMLYIAMFDEVDEGTAIFKLHPSPPVTSVHPDEIKSPSRFAEPEAGLATDHYLWLAGHIQRALNDEQAATLTMPNRD